MHLIYGIVAKKKSPSNNEGVDAVYLIYTTNLIYVALAVVNSHVAS